MKISKETEQKARDYQASLSTGARRLQLSLKRVSDVVASVLALLVLAPFLAALAILIRLGSPGPAIYKQRRLGQYGRIFTMYKFRSMTFNCPVELNPDGSTRVVQGDSRVTPLGNWLRRYGLDELPQLLNILKGDMSFVGPRPDQDFHLALYSDGDYRKLAMKPGLTSLGQVSGRNACPWKLRTLYEIEYVENYSLWLDIRILLRTLKVIADGVGVYNAPHRGVSQEVAASLPVEDSSAVGAVRHEQDG